MIKYIYLSFLFFGASLFSLSAQTVSTWLNEGNISDDLIFGPDGFIYGSDFNKSTVYKISMDGTVTPFATGIMNPNGLAFDADQNLYVVGWGEGKIWKVDLVGDKTELIGGLTNPSGMIKMLNKDTLLFTTPIENKISKLTLDGLVVPYIEDDILNAPVGMDYNDKDELIVANFSDNRIFKVEEDESLSQIVDIDAFPKGIGFIACIEEYIYATMIYTDEIYRTDYDGNFVSVAGSTFGTTDGSAAEAKFSSPNGILPSVSGDSLFISEFGTGAVRVVTDLDVMSKVEGPLPVVYKEIKVFPNPTSEKIALQFLLQESLSSLSVELLDVNGKVVFNRDWKEGFSIGMVNLELALPESLLAGTYFYRLKEKSKVLGGGPVQLQ